MLGGDVATTAEWKLAEVVSGRPRSVTQRLFAAPWFKSSLILLVVCALVAFLFSLLAIQRVPIKTGLTYIYVIVGNTVWWFLLIGPGATAVGAPRQNDCLLGGYALWFFSDFISDPWRQPYSCLLTFSFSRQLAVGLFSALLTRRITAYWPNF